MARNMAFVGGELQVNLVDPLNLTNGLSGAQIEPAVAALENGNFVVVYNNTYGGISDQDIMAVEFTPTGAVAASPFRVEFDPGDQENPDVAQRLGGGYVAVWEDAGASDSIQLVVVTAGTPSDPTEFTVANVVDTLEDPSVATFANGTYIVTYTLNDPTSDDVVFTIVNAAGNTLLRPPTGIGATNDQEVDSAVATSGNVAAVVFTRGIATSDIILKTVDSSGAPVDSETVADIAGATGIPDVAALSDGRFVIVWHEIGSTVDVLGRIYDPVAGTFSTAPFLIVTGPGDQGAATVAGLPDGGFLVTWTDDNLTATVQARRFDATGTPVGDAFLLDGGTPGQFLGVVAANSAGNVFAVWGDVTGENTTDTSPPGLQGQFFLPVTEIVNGTDGNDTIQTYGLSEAINGLKGNDTIHAAGGNDIISGGRGRDLIFGEAGADRFDFNKLGESKVGAALRDILKDFRHSEGDRIDLKDIDADTSGTAGNQRFKFIGADAFSGTDRELRVANGIVQGDTNGDGIANFEIKVVTGGVALVAADFVL